MDATCDRPRPGTFAFDYATFLARKSQFGDGSGFEPLWLPGALFDFQRALVDWAIRRGRAAIYADCGLGKSAMALVWAENVVRHTNRPVLILTPLAVTHQFVREGEKFGVECVRSVAGEMPEGARVVTANYQRLHHFNPEDFAGVVCDESSILKDFDGKTKAAVTEFLRTRPYRLLCTATAAPNDYVEIGTSSEALGYLGFKDMVTRFFKQEVKKDYLGWGRTKYRLRGHAAHDFWRWVCSWARAIRRPSDLGFDDGLFVLPELVQVEHCIAAREKRPDLLFDLPAMTLADQREERRRTLSERCETVAALVADTEAPAICWCHLNDEGDLIERLVADAVQISGSDPDERKEEVLEAFISGSVRVLVSKPSIVGYGLNLQHCAHATFFPSHSFEQFYQAVRRCWRFGQSRSVAVDLVTTPGEEGVLANLQRKAAAAEAMFSRLVELMGDELRIDRSNPFIHPTEAPPWLSSTSASPTDTPSTTPIASRSSRRSRTSRSTS